MNKLCYLQVGLLLLIISSCSSYKKVPYFQDLNRDKTLKETINNLSPMLIQPSDILDINVTSLNPGAWADSTSKKEYLVADDGTVQVPLLGEVKVAGFTTNQVQEDLQKQLSKYLKRLTVNVRVINFKVSVFGDVGHPDVFKIANTRVTLLEALSLAGDLNITALRTNVLLIREVNNKREYQTIDLTSAGVFQSPSYYLKNNDVIYVQPGKTKFANVDTTYRTWSLILSALSIIAIVVVSVRN